ncbi:transposase, partial [Ureibacillus terrenus]|nr:transposase [Ureibacillus terrenus]
FIIGFNRIILSHVFTTANRNDAAVALKLFPSVKEWDIEFALGDAAYDSEKVRQIAEQTGVFFVSPLTLEIVINEKTPMVE